MVQLSGGGGDAGGGGGGGDGQAAGGRAQQQAGAGAALHTSEHVQVGTDEKYIGFIFFIILRYQYVVDWNVDFPDARATERRIPMMPSSLV